jgi:TPR repeat protein
LRHKDWPIARDSFQQIFDGHNPAIAVCLGFIYDQKASTLYNQEKAIEYYTIAGNGDDAYAQYALGGILLEKGEPAWPIDWYARCSAAGDANCSHTAYRLHKNQKQSGSKNIS